LNVSFELLMEEMNSYILNTKSFYHIIIILVKL